MKNAGGGTHDPTLSQSARELLESMNSLCLVPQHRLFSFFLFYEQVSDENFDGTAHGHAFGNQELPVLTVRKSILHDSREAFK